MVNPKFLNQVSGSPISPDQTQENDVTNSSQSEPLEDQESGGQIFNFYNKNLGDLIMPKNALLKDCKLNQAVDFVIKNLKVIPNYKSRKNDNEFILRACNLIENLGIHKKKDKLLKIDVFVKVFQQLFNVTEEDLKPSIVTVEFLLDKNLVKKIKMIKLIVRFVKLNILPNFFL